MADSRRKAALVVVERAERRQEVVRRILCVQTNLDGVAAQLDLVLRERERLALRDLELPADEVGTGDALGDRMLDLEAGVHLQEEELGRAAGLIQQQLNRARAHVADRPHEVDRSRTHRGTK